MCFKLVLNDILKCRDSKDKCIIKIISIVMIVLVFFNIVGENIFVDLEFSEVDDFIEIFVFNRILFYFGIFILFGM